MGIISAVLAPLKVGAKVFGFAASFQIFFLGKLEKDLDKMMRGRIFQTLGGGLQVEEQIRLDHK